MVRRKTFAVDPGRTFVVSLVFTAIMLTQVDFGWQWWAPCFLAVWLLFSVANLIYVKLNNWIHGSARGLDAVTPRDSRRGPTGGSR